MFKELFKSGVNKNTKEKINRENENELNGKLEKYTIEDLLLLKNKDFIFKCLEILNESDRQDDIEKLINPEFCKNRFDMNFPILQEVKSLSVDEKDFRDSCGNRRYYPEIVVFFDKEYIVCNDWYYKNKINKRDTRTSFVNWVMR